jgi:hypothetical protein
MHRGPKYVNGEVGMHKPQLAYPSLFEDAFLEGLPGEAFPAHAAQTCWKYRLVRCATASIRL